jgi:hypothetical protein
MGRKRAHGGNDEGPDEGGRREHDDKPVYEVRDLAEKDGDPTERADVEFREGRTTHSWGFSVGKSGVSVTSNCETPTKSATEIASAMVTLSIASAIPAGVIGGFAAWVSAPVWVSVGLASLIFATIVGISIYLMTKPPRLTHGVS